MAEVDDALEVSLLKLTAMGQHHADAATCIGHIETLKNGVADTLTPIEAIVSQLSLADTKLLQNVLVSGREESRILAIVKVIFGNDMATSEALQKVGVVIEKACTNTIQQLFYQSYMTDAGTIQWTQFGKYINQRIQDLATASGAAAAIAGRG